jgi:hypothetical protein
MSKHHPDGVLNFDHFEHQIFQSMQDQCKFQIQMAGNDHEFVFKAETKEVAIEWMHHIN